MFLEVQIKQGKKVVRGVANKKVVRGEANKKVIYS